jgi:hypothetical protein
MYWYLMMCCNSLLYCVAGCACAVAAQLAFFHVHASITHAFCAVTVCLFGLQSWLALLPSLQSATFPGGPWTGAEIKQLQLEPLKVRAALPVQVKDIEYMSYSCCVRTQHPALVPGGGSDDGDISCVSYHSSLQEGSPGGLVARRHRRQQQECLRPSTRAGCQTAQQRS